MDVIVLRGGEAVAPADQTREHEAHHGGVELVRIRPGDVLVRAEDLAALEAQLAEWQQIARDLLAHHDTRLEALIAGMRPAVQEHYRNSPPPVARARAALARLDSIPANAL